MRTVDREFVDIVFFFLALLRVRMAHRGGHKLESDLKCERGPKLVATVYLSVTLAHFVRSPAEVLGCHGGIRWGHPGSWASLSGNHRES